MSDSMWAEIGAVNEAADGVQDAADPARFPAALGAVDTGHAASTEALGKLNELAAAFPPAALTQMTVAASAIKRIADDIARSDGDR